MNTYHVMTCRKPRLCFEVPIFEPVRIGFRPAYLVYHEKFPICGISLRAPSREPQRKAGSARTYAPVIAIHSAVATHPDGQGRAESALARQWRMGPMWPLPNRSNAKWVQATLAESDTLVKELVDADLIGAGTPM